MPSQDSAFSTQDSSRLVTTEEMKVLEQSAVQQGISLEQLMDNAGLAVAREIQRMHSSQPGSAVVLIGPGNNGGDGLVCAEHLRQAGWQIRLHLTPQPERDRQRFPVLQALQPGPVPVEPMEVVVDALLGTGSSRPIQGPMADTLDAVRACQPVARVVAVDVPSGVNADTGAVDPRTLPASVTVTLGLAKVGLHQFPAQDVAGEVRVVDIGIPALLSADVRTCLSDTDLARHFLPARPGDAHKGTFGKLLVVAGAAAYSGAPYLTSMAAARVGAGVIRLATPRSVHPIVASKFTEATFAPLPETEDGWLARAALPRLQELLRDRYDCLLIGPGLGQDLSLIHI